MALVPEKQAGALNNAPFLSSQLFILELSSKSKQLKTKPYIIILDAYYFSIVFKCLIQYLRYMALVPEQQMSLLA